MKRLFIILALCFCLVAGATLGQTSGGGTVVENDVAEAEQKLLGKHMFSLQWVSHTKFGTAIVTRKDTGLYIKARQELDGNFVTLKGDVRVVNAREFTVTGELVTRVSYINGGNACVRNETFTFKATGARKYWRLQEMQNPCEPGYNLVDYVDVYF